MKESKENRFEVLSKIKKVLDAIQKRRLLDPAKKVLKFELGGFEIKLNNKNDYNELISLLNGLKEQAGMAYKIPEFYFDIKGRKQPFTLYDSRECTIEIIDDKKLNKFTDKILQEYQIIAKTLKKKAQKSIKGKSGEPPCKLPEGTIWEDLEIKFENQFDVEIYLKGKFYRRTDYENLGMYKSGTNENKPDTQWQFLLLLSAIQELDKNKGTVDEMALSIGKQLDRKINRANCEQIKSKLAKELQTAFGINNEPFLPYKDHDYYQPKFKLRPLPELRGSGEPFITKTGYNDNKQYLE